MFEAVAAGLFAWLIVGLLYFEANTTPTCTTSQTKKEPAMFKIVPNPTFTSRVKLTVPGAEQPAELVVTWRHKGRAALSAWLGKPAAAAAAAAATGDASNPLLAGVPADAGVLADAGVPADAAWLGEVMCGWDGPVWADGQPVAFGDVELAALLDSHPAAGGELMAAYLRASTESRAKN